MFQLRTFHKRELEYAQGLVLPGIQGAIKVYCCEHLHPRVHTLEDSISSSLVLAASASSLFSLVVKDTSGFFGGLVVDKRGFSPAIGFLDPTHNNNNGFYLYPSLSRARMM